MKSKTQISIQILNEMEEAIEVRLEEIRAEHKIRNGLLYRNNVDNYATFKDEQRKYESRRVALMV